MNNAYKIAVGVVIILVLVVGGYLFYTRSSGASISEIADNVTGATLATSTLDADRDQTLQRLNELQDITIDTEFLTSDSFRSLENFGISIEPQPAGRSNPFEPATVVEPADVIESSPNIDLTGDSENQQGGVQSTTSQSTTSVDQLLEGGNERPQNATNTPEENGQ